MKYFPLALLLAVVANILAAPATESPVLQLLKSNYKFSNQLYTQVAKTQPKNFIFSPISIHVVLSMLYQGASSKTYEALGKGLNLPDASLVADGYKSVIADLAKIKEVSVYMANKVYINDKYTLKPEFKDIVRNSFSSEVEPIDFANGDSYKAVNKWVEEKTKEKIKNIAEPDSFSDSTSLVLVNAVYFKGSWRLPFNEINTQPGKFFVSDDETVTVPLMHQTESFKFKHDNELKAKVLQLPYVFSKDGESTFTMTVILPDEKNGIDYLESKLASYDLDQLKENLSYKSVEVTLPKFKIETKLNDLKNHLDKLGLSEIFNGENLNGLLANNQSLAVSDIIHKAFIQVTEKSTEAAAATVTIVGSSFNSEPPKTFVADHPFIILLRQSTEGPVFFYGRVSNPKINA